jgi:murein DD-endopeptidase MepM/ murein hydrolase activator NlpD
MAALAITAVLLDVPALAQGRDLGRIERDLDAAAQEQAELQRRLDAATRAREQLVVDIAVLDEEREQLSRTVARLRGELDDLEVLVGSRIRAVFKHGAGLDPLVVFLASDDPSAALARVEAVQRAVDADRASTEALSVTRIRLQAAEGQLVERQDALDGALARQEGVGEELQATYAALEESVRGLEREARAERERQARLEAERQARAERERQARLEAERQAAPEVEGRAAPRAPGEAAAAPTREAAPPAASSSGGMACPLDQPRSFIDSWGQARSGGRAHRGTDIMGPRGIPVRAIADGVWRAMAPGASAGLWGVLRADNGDHFWYLHLDSHSVASGTRVRAGQQIGTNGSTGNAVAGAEHVHFEHHVGGSRPVNPYPLLRRVCG